MTAQIPDQVIYNDKSYALIGIKGEGLLTPADFGMSATMWHTACYRGYVATYLVDENDLFLTKLHIGYLMQGSEWLPIDGVMPESHTVESRYSKDGEFITEMREDGKIYSSLRVATGFSGGLLIATGFIRDLYVHMGFGKPYQFEFVDELIFHEGMLIEAVDHSEKAAAWRATLTNLSDFDQEKVENLRRWGYSTHDIREMLSKPSDEEMMADTEWRFSLDYGEWF